MGFRLGVPLRVCVLCGLQKLDVALGTTQFSSNSSGFTLLLKARFLSGRQEEFCLLLKGSPMWRDSRGGLWLWMTETPA